MDNKKYNVIGDKSYELQRTTARTEQALAELGLSSDFIQVDDSPDTEVKNSDQALQEILKEGGDKLIQLCNVIFVKCDLKEADAIDIDKSAVREAVMDFFMRDLMLIGKYLNYSKTLSSPT
jgi:hypothetical protein